MALGLPVYVALPIALTVYLQAPVKAYAQGQNTGSVAGRITDGQGKAVASAKLSLKSAAQGRIVTATSNSQGEYVFNAVPVATYTLTVTSPTFAPYVAQELIVDANQNVNLDPVLRPASENVSVTVTSEESIIDTRSATLATVIDNRLVEDLPLDGNNLVELAALLPGVTDVNAPTTFTSDNAGPTYNISGSRNNQNLFLLDGTIWNNLYNNTGINYPPRYATEQVSVLLNNYGAQYGRNAGSVFNVITRSGSNKFHGVLYEYVQNKALNATDYLSQANPFLVQNQFGATLGGPILRNKLFFFLAYQDLRSSTAVTAQAQTPHVARAWLDFCWYSAAMQ